MKQPRHILLIRFSALGDVAMTVPVVRNLLQQYPDLQVSFVSEPFMAPLFAGIDRLHFVGVSTKKEFRGLNGLRRLAAQLRKEIDFDAVGDMHDVLRTKILRIFLFCRQVAVIDKGRKEKKSLTRANHKKLRPLKSGFQRYADVLAKLGYPVDLSIERGLSPKATDANLGSFAQPGNRLIGIAPFARHAAKMYPLDKMKAVLTQLSSDPVNRIILLGSPAEGDLLKEWESVGENVQSVAGKLSFRDELKLISQLNLMISMDSANMHLASLYGVPVVSVWGGTHPWLGFYGWGQDPDNAVQSNLPCRPSSVFGNKPCPVHGEAGCMQEISPMDIVHISNKILNPRAPYFFQPPKIGG
jgi:ADP-heptose:LPS heptosyltransferase